MKRIFLIALLVLSGGPAYAELVAVAQSAIMPRYTLTLRRSVAMESW